MIIVYINLNSFIKIFDKDGKQLDYNSETIKREDGTLEIKGIYLNNGFKRIELENKYFDCEKIDFDENFEFSIEKYNARKQVLANKEYENKIVALIRKKYNINQELAILRQRDAKPQEYQEYYDYVEQCKKQVKNEL